MILIDKTEVAGWEHVIRGMRNPMNSWAKSDSGFTEHELEDWTHEVVKTFDGLGNNDHDLMVRLAGGGPVHAKYRRMIIVYVDITAPLYWWKEFDTYKIGTVTNSCSTMHKIQEKEFVVADFSCEHLTRNWNGDNAESVAYVEHPLRTAFECQEQIPFTPFEILRVTINALNTNREAYHKTKDTKYWWQMIQLLPSSYNQKRTVMLNYEVLTGIYLMRKDHKLDEWRDFCAWIEKLPYSELITGTVNDEHPKTPNELRAEYGLPPIKNSDFRLSYLGKPMKPETYISDNDRLIISAYTGFLMCDFCELHEFVEKTLGRPVFTHELANDEVMKEIRERLSVEWLKICGTAKNGGN